jgi:uncharacterized protein YycO
MVSKARLLPGDVLLYNRQGFYNTLIRIKTWSVVSHVAVVLDGFTMVESRNGKGVGAYDINLDGLYCVLRPKRRIDIDAAYAWFETVNGQGYDWIGLLAFASAKFQGKENGKMFCSEFAARFLRAGGLDPFNGADADAIAPSDFLKNSAFKLVEVPYAQVARASR